MMANDHNRQSTRLRDHDYSEDGAYFVTICTKDRNHSFGEICNGVLVETEQARICLSCWRDLPNHYPLCALDSFVIMPNHVHGIIMIENVKNIGVGAGFKPAPTTKRYSLSEIIRGFKTFVARKVNVFQKTEGQPFWQRNYYDRVIRDEEELYFVREYIARNPENWEYDKNNPEGVHF